MGNRSQWLINSSQCTYVCTTKATKQANVDFKRSVKCLPIARSVRVHRLERKAFTRFGTLSM